MTRYDPSGLNWMDREGNWHSNSETGINYNVGDKTPSGPQGETGQTETPKNLETTQQPDNAVSTYLEKKCTTRYFDEYGNLLNEIPSETNSVFVVINDIPYLVEPTKFTQDMFSKEKKFNEKFSNTACNATAALNAFSEQYTWETGKQLSVDKGIQVMKDVANNKEGHINYEDAKITDLAPAMNDMINSLEKIEGRKIFSGKFVYSPGWLGYKEGNLVATYKIDAFKAINYEEHFVNHISNRATSYTVYDTYDGKVKEKSSSDFKKQNIVYYYNKLKR